jgi:hypothetical protein
MTALITAYTGDGCVGRCDAKCYHAWGRECHCVCQGVNHGVGRQEAIANTRELAGSWLDRAGAARQVITLTELAADAQHQPSFNLGGVR